MMRVSDARWPEVRLGDVCEFKYGKSLPESARANGSVPVFGSNGQVGWHDETLTNGATIIIGRKGSFGEVNFSGQSCWPIDTTYYVDGSATKADLRWLYHRLGSLGLNQLNRAAAVPGLNREDAYRKRLLLPSLSEQRRIADILDKADALRAKRRAALAQFDTLGQSIFISMFGDPIVNPKGWPNVWFEELCERLTVGVVVRPASYYVPAGVPALRSLNIKADQILRNELVYFSAADNETKLAKTRLKAGDLVLVRSGQPGTAAVVPEDLNGVNAIDLLIATPNTRLVDVTFLCTFFNSRAGRNIVLSGQRGQVQKHLNVGELSEAIIPLPPLTEQRTFALRIARLKRQVETQRSSLKELDRLFASLQNRAFSGKLTPNAASKAA